jgi:hypothetical protein
MKFSPKNLNTVSPAEYKISVFGLLDDNLVNRLCGFTIQSQEDVPGTGKAVITLTGSLADQAALLGALNALYNMRMPLISVEYLGESESKGDKS